jgi:hypothetical protein
LDISKIDPEVAKRIGVSIDEEPLELEVIQDIE